MNQTLANVNDTDVSSVLQDLSDQIAQLQASMDQVNRVSSQVQNTTGAGIGSVTPTVTRAAVVVPPVSQLAATNLGTTMGETRVGLTWLAPDAVGSPIDHYNVYIKSSLIQQLTPTLVASPAASPAAFTFQPDAAGTVVISVQTVLANGQVNAIGGCPTTTVVTTLPVLSVPQGGTGTATGSITGTGALTFTSGPTNTDLTLTTNGTGKIIAKPGTDSTTAVQLQNAAGTAIVTTDTASSRVGVNCTPAHTVDLGSAVTSRKLAVFASAGDFYGFGIASGILRYDAGSGGDHVFYTSSGTETVRIKSNLGLQLTQMPLISPPTNANAVGAGLAAGTLYRGGADPDVVYIVH